MSDELFLSIVFALFTGAILTLYNLVIKPIVQLITKRMKGKKQSGLKDGAMDKMVNQTRRLLLQTLKDIDCQYEIDQDDYIVFKYQEEEFKIDVSRGNNIIWIYTVAWGGIDINDLNANYLKQAINKVNESSAMTNLYTINEEKGFIATHCHMAIFFANNIPNYKKYFKSVLDGFLTAHQEVRTEFANLSTYQEEKERIVVKGFC